MDCKEFALESKVILVTGAAGLIGQEVADAYVAYGANVVLTDLSPALGDVAGHLNAKYSPGSALPVKCDLTDETQLQALFEKIEREFGRLDVLTHLAAIDAKFDSSGKVEPTRFENYPISLWEKSVAVNCTGTIRILQHAIRLMLKRAAGSIILTASTYSLVAPNPALYVRAGSPSPYKPVDYVGTKSMVPNLIRYIGTLYGRDGIRCNAVVPHGVMNDHPEAFQSSFAELSPLGRMCNPAELRAPFVFLAGDGSSYVNGASLVVDGGWTAW